jgi:hypothetical protein
MKRLINMLHFHAHVIDVKTILYINSLRPSVTEVLGGGEGIGW